MTKKLLALLLTAVSFTLCLCGCEKESPDLELLHSKLNNEVALSDVLTKQYAKADFENLLTNEERAIELSEWHQRFPIEVMRSMPVNKEAPIQGGKLWYTVYQTNEGGYSFVLFTNTIVMAEIMKAEDVHFTDESIMFAHLMYCELPLDTAALDGIEIGDTADEVLLIDQDAVLQYIQAGNEYCSMHLLKDGRVVQIYYDAEKRIVSKYDSYSSILPQDVPQ